MKWLSFRIIAVVMLLSQLPFASWADEASGGPISGMSAYQERLLRRQQRWKKLIPNLFTLQYAGDIGMLSAGFGWDYGPKNKWETHILFGYLPPRCNHQHYWTFTLREIFSPWNIRFNERWSLKPLSVNLSISSILHDDFWTSEPERYPSGYYGFSSRVRFHLGLGQRLNFHIPEERRYLSRTVSVYYEISTCDLYVRQKFLNSSIPLKDIIVFALGFIYTI